MHRKVVFVYDGKVTKWEDLPFNSRKNSIDFTLNESNCCSRWKNLPFDVVYAILALCNLSALKNYNSTCKAANSMLQGNTTVVYSFWKQKMTEDKLIIFQSSNSVINCTFHEYAKASISKYKATKMFNIMDEEFHIEMTEGEMITDEMLMKLGYNDRPKLQPKSRTGCINWSIDAKSKRGKFTELEKKLAMVISYIIRCINCAQTLCDGKKRLNIKSKNIERLMQTMGTQYEIEVSMDTNPTNFDISISLVENKKVNYGESGPPIEHVYDENCISQETAIMVASMLLYYFPKVEWYGRYHGITNIHFNENMLRKDMHNVRYSNIDPFHKRLELLEKYRLQHRKV